MRYPPPGAVGPGPTRVLLALVALHERRRWAATVREVTDLAGFRSTSTVWFHLLRLRRVGLVAWSPGRARTLRPLVGDYGPPWPT